MSEEQRNADLGREPLPDQPVGPAAPAQGAGPAAETAHAQSAGPAAHAQSAGPAAHAQSAGPAAHAQSAESAAHAESAENAAHAQSAESAAHAESAENAENAGPATDAARAESPPRKPPGPQLRIPTRPEPPPAPDQRGADLEAQLAEAKQQLQRMAADFENYRRRIAAEKDELVSFASSRVLENFLPIVDNFERALAHMASADAVAIRQGVEMIYRQVTDFLGRQGVAPMEAIGQVFDPNIHEAIGQAQTSEHPDNTVLAEAQKGYLLNGRVLRHAMVQIAFNPVERAAAEAATETAPAAAQTPAGNHDQPADAGQPPAEAGEPPAEPLDDEEDFTLEDLMAEAAPVPEGSKEESHG